MDIDSPNILEVSTNISAPTESSPILLEETNHEEAVTNTEIMIALAPAPALVPSTNICHNR